MIVLTANTSGPKHEARVAGRDNIGQLLSPSGWRNPSRVLWACDNDVFAAWKKSLDQDNSLQEREYWRHYWDVCGEGERKWLQMLGKVEVQATDPLFVLLPDAVADWPLTVKRAYHYLPEVMARDLRFAIALQDGCDFRQALSLRPHTVFVGGSVRWKWLNVEPITRYFQARGVKVHVGRVSGPRRIRECLRVGVDSCDGTGWTTNADKMLPVLWSALEENTSPQMSMEL